MVTQNPLTGGRRGLRPEDLSALRIPSDVQLSPDGSTVAFVLKEVDAERDEYRTTIWSVPLAGGAATRLTEGPADLAPRWSPDGTSLVYLGVSGDDPDGPPQIHVRDLAAGATRRLTDLEGGAAAPVSSPAGDRIAFSRSPQPPSNDDPVVITKLAHRADGVGLRPQRGADLFVVDVATAATRLLVDGSRFAPLLSFYEGPPVWAPDGRSIAHAWNPLDDELAFALAVYVVSADDGKVDRVTDEHGFHAVADWSADGARLLLAGQERFQGESRHTRMFEVEIEHRTVRPIAPDLDRQLVLMPRYAPGGRGVLACIGDGGTQPLRLVPLKGGSSVEIFGAGRSVSSFSAIGDRVSAVVRDEGSFGEVETTGLGGGEPRRLTNLTREALPDVAFVEPQARSIESGDGTQVHAWLLRPTDAQGPTRLVVSIHGGPHMSWGPALDDFTPYHQSLVALGWTVLMPNPRGSDGYGEAYMSEGSWTMHDEDDLIAWIDELIADGTAAEGHVAVVGYSYGGYMTCWMTSRRDRFSAAVAGGTFTDIPSAMWSSDLAWFRVVAEMWSSPWQDPERWLSLSPVTHAMNVKAPTLLFHGANDDRCPLNQAEAWFVALKGAGVPVEMVVYPGGSHDCAAWPPSHRVDSWRRVERWLDDHTPRVDGPA